MVISGNQQFLRTINRLAVLRAVRIAPGISRAQLADNLDLTRPTIGNLVDGLLADGWLQEQKLGPTGALGRRPVALHVNNDELAIIGADVNNQRVICAATSLSGEVRELRVLPLASAHYERALETVADETQRLWQRMEAAGVRVAGMGIGLPGQVDTRTGILQRSETTGWNNLPVKDIVQALFNKRGIPAIPLRIQRAADCVALYHFEFTRTAEEEPLLYIHVGRGVTSSIASRYSLLRGHHGSLGSIGHVVLDTSGPSCTCGRRGCVNSMASLAAVERVTGCPIGDIPSAAQAGNAQVIRGLQQAGENFGIVMYNLSMQFAPARLLLGGLAVQSSPEFLAAAITAFRALHGKSVDVYAPPEVVQHENNAVALGAATGALYSLLSPL